MQVRPRLPRTQEKQHAKLEVQDEVVRGILHPWKLSLRGKMQLPPQGEERRKGGRKNGDGAEELSGNHLPDQRQVPNLIYRRKMILNLFLIFILHLFYQSRINHTESISLPVLPVHFLIPLSLIVSVPPFLP